MPGLQQLLFPDPRPLVERLGRDFFRSLPQSAGVYVMRDAEGAAIYIGKAKNLRQRLAAYRVANPDRMKRRHLRLLASAVAIQIEHCSDESTALRREAELIARHSPRFNRVGTWPTPRRLVAWRRSGETLILSVTSAVEEGWKGIGPMGSARARRLRGALLRLLWLVSCRQRQVAEMPWGWVHGKFGSEAAVEWTELDQVVLLLRILSKGDGVPLRDFLADRLGDSGLPYASSIVMEDLDTLSRPLRFFPAEEKSASMDDA